MMKNLRWFVFGLSLLLVGAALAKPSGNGKHLGWPNHGIAAPGQPNHYASPNPHQHP